MLPRLVSGAIAPVGNANDTQHAKKAAVAAMRPPRRVAIGFYGEYQKCGATIPHGPTSCSDFFLSERNIWHRVIEPLMQAGIVVAVYFHTVKAEGCMERDAALVDALRPLQYEFGRAPLNSSVDSALEVLQLIRATEAASAETSVLLLRFDVQYTTPILSWGIDWEVVNLAFRDLSENWDRCRMASDLFHVLPLRALPAVSVALRRSAEQDIKNCSAGRGTGKYLYDPLIEQLGEAMLRFIAPGHHSLDGPLPGNIFLSINHTCIHNPPPRANTQLLPARGPAPLPARGPAPTSKTQLVPVRGAEPLRRCGHDPYANASNKVREYVSQAQPQAASPLLPRRVVLGFHGDYQRQEGETVNGGCSDFFNAEQNIRQQVMQPLLDRGIEVAVYFHTMARCKEKDQALVDALKPLGYKFAQERPRQIRDSYVEVLKLIAGSEPASNGTRVVLLRFDVQYRVPVIELDIKWEAMNFAFRDRERKWRGCKMVSDLLHIFPLSLAPTVTAVLAEEPLKGGCTNKKNINGALHYIYPALQAALGQVEIHFISPACSTSGLTWPWHPKGFNNFLALNRDCGGKDHYCSAEPGPEH